MMSFWKGGGVELKSIRKPLMMYYDEFYFSRVHITKATLLELGGKFEVEDGKGRERDEVLAKLNIDTFLIIPPKQIVRYLLTFL